MNRIPRSYNRYPISAKYEEVSEEEAKEIREQLNKRNLEIIINKK